ncbi:hypothetical protein AU184_15450 [Mycolicibacterium novocastrense]|uniref:glycosyltransferase n=1 Tax=Mycolicibacterium novocastrense TaxID=59813 RepID=UPI0007467347|nr:glycosyltransferase [Mycolicibacterium novocastrense]KUH75779.1 hypothetical protein AU183_00470 [Mycolicibacterium novocastrense]KUH78340.1 hypothetical protein AU072_10530 [Mycolicibacterium novocastrense]KUH79675.1 hypothetical protein AU184_15450 [Mycolicibacterium novocastrense]
MIFALASYGTRGDIEPCAALGRELLRRGHEVRMAVPPDLIGFVESAGLSAVGYGMEIQEYLDLNFIRTFWSEFFRDIWTIRKPISLVHKAWEPIYECWGEMNTTLMSLADGADVLFTGVSFEQPAANVAEYYDLPLATLHWMPIRPNRHTIPGLPRPVVRSAMTALDWVYWRSTKRVDDAQRAELGLPKTKGPSSQRLAERAALEIQAYDEACFPGLATEWAKFNGQRPFVGALTMELTTDADDEVASWIADGTPPICFAFGSMSAASPAETLEMISAACEQLGERALICAGWTDFGDVYPDHVKVVGAVNYSAAFSACRAVVHHGGSGTTAASLRAGVPSLILWTLIDQQLWGAMAKRLKVGRSRRLVSTTRESLVADLRKILAPEYAARARDFATSMTKASESVSRAADLMEEFAHTRRSRRTA